MRVLGFVSGELTLGNQLEKRLEHEMETEHGIGFRI